LRRKTNILVNAKKLVYCGLKTNWEEERRKSSGWRKALRYHQLKSRKESFINWAFFVQRAKQQRFVSELISNKVNTRIKEELLQTFIKAYQEQRDLRERAEELRRMVNKRVAVEAFSVMLTNAPIMAVERSLNERAAVYSQYRLFRKVVTSILIHKERRQEQRVATEMAAQQWRGSLLNLGFNLLANNRASSKILMSQAGDVHMRGMMEKGLRGLRLWIGMAKEEIPLYSNRQVFLAHKYFSILGQPGEPKEGMSWRPAGQESDRHRTNRDSRRGVLPSRLPVMNEEDQSLSLGGEVERCDVSIEAARGTAIVYEFPQMSSRFNRRRLEHSTACLNHLIMEKIFTSWKNRVVKKKEFVCRRQFKMLSQVFKGLQTYYWQKSEESYLLSRGSSFHRKRLLHLALSSLHLNSTKLKQLRELERHYTVSRAQRIKERILVCMRGAFYSSTDERRRIMLGIAMSNRWSKRRLVGLLKGHVQRQRWVASVTQGIRVKITERLVQQVWNQWIDRLKDRLLEREGEQKVAAARTQQVLSPCFDAWRYWASYSAKNRLLVDAFQHHSGLATLQRVLHGLKQHAENSRKAKMFDLVLDNYHLRKLMKKSLIGLRCHRLIQSQKRQMQSTANQQAACNIHRSVHPL
jgi:hypothetical protein